MRPLISKAENKHWDCFLRTRGNMEGAGSVLKSVPYIGEGLEKIKSKNWAEPLGIGLQVTGEIFELAGEAGLPVIGLIGKTIFHIS